MFGLRLLVSSPAIGPNPDHQDCGCVGLVVAVPDGKLLLDFPSVDDLEAFGWAILGQAEAMKKASVPTTIGASHAPR